MARHSAQDGKGPREVYVNGELVQRVVWADDARGRVLCHRYPYVVRNGTLRRCYLQGKVEVRPIG